jgi:phytanoyl-CoA hydroxylase
MAALLMLLCTPTAAAAACCDAQLIHDAAVSFARDGFAVLPSFASEIEVNAMRSAMEGMVEAWWNEERAAPDHGKHVFTTGSNQTSAQAKSSYFFTSADRVHFFREAVDEGDTPSTRPRPPLNKVGHGLHLNASTPFGAYARSERVSAVARKVAGLVAPVLPQSMYIFKEARLGGAVTSHQDGTFLYTRPHQTVVGLWLALDAAHEGNGCLWARPGSHHEPLRRRFVRTLGEAGDVVMTFVNASAEEPEVYLSAQLRGGDATPAPANASNATTKVKWWQRLLRWARRRLALRVHKDRLLERSEHARAWEGVWPPADMASGTHSGLQAAKLLSARGFIPLNVKAGDLVVFPGTLDHLSLPNGSPHARHTFQLHMVEGPSAGVEWAHENWLQYDGGLEFMSI